MAIVLMEGPLSKWTNVVKGWQYRWFVLDENTGLLSYYTSKDKMMRGSRRGCLRLQRANIGIDDEDDSTFTINSDQKTFHFQAQNAEERERWIGALEVTIKRHSQTRKRTQVGHRIEFDPTHESLEQRLAEAEAYFKILTKQVKALEGQMNADPVAHKSERYAVVKDSSAKMLESVGQCLELMYAAKTECEKLAPISAGDNGPVLPAAMDHFSAAGQNATLNNKVTSLNIGDQVDSGDQHMSKSKSDSALSLRDKTSSLSSEEGAELDMSHRVTSRSSVELSQDHGGEDSASSSYRSQLSFTMSPTITSSVPFTSYSSSDDDDDAEFFDADEFQDFDKPIVMLSRSIPKGNPHTSGDFDSEDDDDKMGGEIERTDKHSSIITHLLSQVRLGMDLTKVVLPTFILERRSLLEMYADFFAHPDLFTGIVDMETPRERIVGVVRWYLSAFHAGRKGSIAKKPYNPILGETFRCFWKLPEFESTRSEETLKDSPVPWASKDDVTFVAEQVSHHPPISAFYAENHTKKIYCSAHIWTKSKFLGLSVGVECAGEGRICVLPYDEEYTVTFPNGYGRSILTVPWMEIGGKCNINCAKTGYSAVVQFHCRPFYGGKKHRITCEIMAADDKKPFMTISGEWNGQMYAKCGEQDEPTLFVDTTTLPIIRKNVLNLNKQEEFESRRLWKDVTANLKIDDVDRATEAKHKLEERQRAEARERKEQGISWETKLFHEDGEHWLYDRPLRNRLATTT